MGWRKFAAMANRRMSQPARGPGQRSAGGQGPAMHVCLSRAAIWSWLAGPGPAMTHMG